MSKLFPGRPNLPVFPHVNTLNKKYENEPEERETLENNLNTMWRPTLSVIGINGPPSDLSKAGNVVYKELTYRLSLRTGPNQDAAKLTQKIKEAVERPGDDTHGAEVTYSPIDVGNGFCAPDLPEDIKTLVNESTKAIFDGNDPVYTGCGGSIPFMEVFAQ